MTFRVITNAPCPPIDGLAPRTGGLDASLLPAFLAPPGRPDLLEQLRSPGILAVTTGQQPALFTGPMYTVHKALSAGALAEALERRWQRRVVPIFWVAGDDHDFAEANHAAWLGSNGEIRRAALPDRPADAPMLPLYREPLGAEVTEALDDFAATVPPSEYRSWTLEWLQRHFRPEATIAGSTGNALAELLAPFGIACLDSTNPAFKRAAGPFLLRALRDADELESALVARAAELASAGADGGVAVGDGATLVMLEGVAGRDRLVRDGQGYVTRRGRERFSFADLERLADQQPERLSPNVLLRPVIESALLPTAAYAAGPGELRYLALTEPIYRHLGVTRQVAVPRWSGTVVDARVDRILAKFGLSADDLAQPLSALETAVVRRRLPAEAEAELSALRSVLTGEFSKIRLTAERIDPTLVRSVDGRRDRALADADRIERKLVAHLKRRLATELRQLGAARDAIRPDGSPQERVLCAPSFLVRHGPRVVEAVAERARAWYADALEHSPVPV